MGKFRVTAAFSEERLVKAKTAEEAEQKGRQQYSRNSAGLVESLRITVEDCSDTSEAAYQRLLAKTQCNADYCRSLILSGLSADTRVDFLMAQIKYLGIQCYSRDYVDKLVRENLRRLYVK